MAKFFKNLFTTSPPTNLNLSEEKKPVKEKKESRSTEETNTPYDTKRKLSISRSGRMKQHLKARGKLGGDLYGELPHKIENTSIEYRVNKRNFFNDDSQPPDSQKSVIENNLDVPPPIEKSQLANEADQEIVKSDTVNDIENNFKYLDSLDDENPNDPVYLEENISKFKETNF